MKRIASYLVALVCVANSATLAFGENESAQPNILFCIADDASYPHMSAYGCNWVKTPGFDRVAKQGLLFSNAYTPNAKCAPSRACILTGRNSWQLGQAANHWCFFPTEYKTYCEALSENGYFVGYTTKGWAPGVAKDDAGKKRQMTGRQFNKHRIKPPTTGISAADYATNFESFVEAAPTDKPWCFWYGSVEPHRRYEFGSGVSKGGKKTTDIDKVPDFWPDNETVRNDMLDYALEIEHFDSHLTRMLDFLEEKGLSENTIVVVTADNGMPFPRIKGQEYELSNHLPLAIRWPKGIAKPGRKIDDYVSFIDFAPTFMEAAGVEWKKTGMKPATGRSLTEIFQSEKAGQVIAARDHVVIGKERHDIGRPLDAGYPIRGIVKNGMLYLHNFETTRWPGGNPETGYLNCDGGATKTTVLDMHRSADAEEKQAKFWQLCFGKRPQEEMFNVKTDQVCMKNLADNPEFAKLKKDLKEQLFAELKTQGDPRMEGKGDMFDHFPYADAKGKGFYERFTGGEKVKAGWVNETDFEK